MPQIRHAKLGLSILRVCDHVCAMAVQGMCSFNLLQDKACCPICRNAVKPVTCAFVGCAWLFDGRKLGPNGSIICTSSDWKVHLPGPGSLLSVHLAEFYRAQAACFDGLIRMDIA